MPELPDFNELTYAEGLTLVAAARHHIKVAEVPEPNLLHLEKVGISFDADAIKRALSGAWSTASGHVADAWKHNPSFKYGLIGTGLGGAGGLASTLTQPKRRRNYLSRMLTGAGIGGAAGAITPLAIDALKRVREQGEVEKAETTARETEAKDILSGKKTPLSAVSPINRLPWTPGDYGAHREELQQLNPAMKAPDKFDWDWGETSWDKPFPTNIEEHMPAAITSPWAIPAAGLAAGGGTAAALQRRGNTVSAKRVLSPDIGATELERSTAKQLREAMGKGLAPSHDLTPEKIKLPNNRSVSVGGPKAVSVQTTPAVTHGKELNSALDRMLDTEAARVKAEHRWNALQNSRQPLTPAQKTELDVLRANAKTIIETAERAKGHHAALLKGETTDVTRGNIRRPLRSKQPRGWKAKAGWAGSASALAMALMALAQNKATGFDRPARQSIANEILNR